MKKFLLALMVVTVIGNGGLALANHHDDHDDHGDDHEHHLIQQCHDGDDHGGDHDDHHGDHH